MKRNQHLPLSLTINYNGTEYLLKAIKNAYNNQEVMYKIALPTVLSETNQCWISRNGLNWKIVMGLAVAQPLVRAIIAGIQKYEQAALIYDKAANDLKLKSA